LAPHESKGMEMDYLADIIGQERVLGVLRQALSTGRMSHAYLFSGPPGVGKMTTALAWARTIVMSSDPQGEIYWREGIHPDFLLIEKAPKKTLIGIEQINREMEPWLALKPYRSGHRVVIIDQAHLLSLPAANALLKTLEEPPAHAVIILTVEDQRVLETILSRCQLIRFAPVSEADIKSLLEQRGIAANQARQIARLSQGSIAAAVQWAGEGNFDQVVPMARDRIRALQTGTDLEVFRCAEEIEKQPLLLVGLYTAMLRDILVLQNTGQADLLILEDNRDYYSQLKSINTFKSKTCLQKIEELGRQFRGPANPLLLSINISYLLRDALK